MIHQNDWPEAYQLANMMNFRFPQFTQIPIETVVPNLSKDALHLLKDMLQWNPSKRPTAVQSLKYAYFANVDLSVTPMSEKTVTNVKTAPNMSEYKKSAASHYQSSQSKTMPSYVQPSSPNVDNHSIQQLQMQIGSQMPNGNGPLSSKVSSNSNGTSNVMINAKSAVSMKDQYLARSRYIAGQNTKSGLYKNSGKSC